MLTFKLYSLSGFQRIMQVMPIAIIPFICIAVDHMFTILVELTVIFDIFGTGTV